MKKNFSELKIFWKPFLVVFLICFLIINWNSISWIFNYKVISQFFSDPPPFNEILNLNGEDYFSLSPTSTKVVEYSKGGGENSLEIPKLGISAPLILVGKEQVESALDRGVVFFPDSVLPGEKGQTIILGHSAPSGWPKIKYDWVFSNLSELKEGDEIFLHFNHRKYTYSVKKKIFLERGERIPQDLTSSENTLILISCWPPGKDLRRIAVEAR